MHSKVRRSIYNLIKKTPPPEEILKEFQEKISSKTTIEETISFLHEVLKKRFNIPSFSIYLKDTVFGGLKAKNNFFPSPPKITSPVIREELLLELKFNSSSSLRKQNLEERLRFLDSLGCEAVLPLKTSNGATALLLLDKKIPKKIFTHEEIILLRELGLQTVLQLENCLLFLEKEKSKHLAVLGKASASIAHEIKNFLTPIKGAVDYLERKYRKDKFVGIIQKEVNNLNKIVQQFLNYSHLPTPSKQKCDLRKIVNNTVEVVPWKDGKVAIKKQFPEKLSPLQLDPDLIKHALVNIILNSIESMEDGGELLIKIMEKKEKIIMEIKDQGKGIPSEVLPKIWEPFFTTKKRGLGLGLSIVKEIIETHKGKIEIKSKVKKGTTVRLCFPK